MSTQKPWRVRRKKVPPLRKHDSIGWAGKLSEPAHLEGYDPESIDKRVTEAIAKGLKV